MGRSLQTKKKAQLLVKYVSFKKMPKTVLTTLDDADQEEPESLYKMMRTKVEEFMNHSKSGKAINIVVALLSLFSSFAFVILTYYDLRRLNPCCEEALKNFDEFIVSS